MKIDIIGTNDYIVYCIDSNKIEFDSKNEVKKSLKNIFEYIKKMFDIEISGTYNIVFYLDDLENYIIEINLDTDDLLYIKNRLDINILLHEGINILFKTDNYFYIDSFRYDHDIYFYKNEYYLKLKKPISSKKYLFLLETTDIIYKNTKKITKEYMKVKKKMLK